MKVLLVVPRMNAGGAESCAYTLANGFKAKGIDVCVASGGGVLADRLSACGIRHYYCPVRANRYLASVRLANIIKREKITLVHAHSTAAAFPTALACRRTLTPWVMTAHGVFHKSDTDKGIGEARKIICVSDFLRHYLIANAAIDSTKFVMFYSGIDLNLFDPGAVKDDFRRLWGLAEDDFVVGLVGRIAKLNNKGHMDIIRSMRSQTRDTPWKLLIVGKGNAQWQLRLITALNHLNRRIKFVGRQIDMPAVIQVCDALILPSRGETFGLVLAEGMAMGKPVIAYEAGGTPEAIENGVSGFLVRRGDKEGMMALIDRLYHDRELCRRIGQNGRQRVRDLFNSDTAMARTIEVYEEVLGRRVFQP